VFLISFLLPSSPLYFLFPFLVIVPSESVYQFFKFWNRPAVIYFVSFLSFFHCGFICPFERFSLFSQFSLIFYSKSRIRFFAFLTPPPCHFGFILQIALRSRTSIVLFNVQIFHLELCILRFLPFYSPIFSLYFFVYFLNYSL
jgi:hypothetical protein